MKRFASTGATLFRGATYVAVEDTKSGVVRIEFVHARMYATMQFALLAKEKDRCADEVYIEGLIDAYHRDPGKFSSKRRVSKA